MKNRSNHIRILHKIIYLDIYFLVIRQIYFLIKKIVVSDWWLLISISFTLSLNLLIYQCAKKYKIETEYKIETVIFTYIIDKINLKDNKETEI